MAKIFKRGLLAILPIALTIAILTWLFQVFEHLFGPPLKALVGEHYYFRGLGILVALFLIFCFGILINTLLIQKIYHLGERVLIKIPFVKTLYRSICDFLSFFRAKGAGGKEGRVVSLTIGGVRVIGLVTRESFKDLPSGLGHEGEVAVFIPLSYQIGGFYVMVPKGNITPIDMPVEDAMRYVLMAGVQGKN